ncbi:MAG: comEA protein [Phycisphaerales bacterium]|nr:comEA protein [Phycisphaerales bacterium]
MSPLFGTNQVTLPMASSLPTSPLPLFPSAPRRRRGTILVAALWAVVILTSVILVFARSMRVEAISANNRVSSAQAAAVVRGAEQYVLSLADVAAGDPSSLSTYSFEALPVGEDPYDGNPLGYFWLIKPDPTNNQLLTFGLTDENAKLDVGSAAATELAKLPGMTDDVVAAIADWRDTDSDVTSQGAENDYYMSLPQPYNAKNDRFETVEELRLVRGITNDILYGYDRNRDGVLDARERSYGGMATSINSAQGDGRGLAPFLTVYSTEPAAATGTANVNGDAAAIQQALAKVLSADRAQAIVQRSGAGGGQQGGGPPASQPSTAMRFTSVFDFCFKGQMTADEVDKAYDSLSASSTATTQPTAVRGRINLNTAPAEVLACLPGLEQADVDKLVNARSAQTATSSVAWAYEALGGEKAAAIGARLTNKSYQYTADIVAVTGNGKGFRRVRVVVDARQSPARIIYRKDLTELGWPLDLATRETLRQGGTLEPTNASVDPAN